MTHTSVMPWDKIFDDIDEEYKHIFKTLIQWGYKALIAERTILFSDGSEETDIVKNIEGIDMYSIPNGCID